LVILDEIGRGTATYDGLAIAWASLEHLHDINRPRALFATHYHELTALAGRLDRLRCMTMAVKEWNGEIIFLHQVKEGAADRSYGIEAAKRAGLPSSVVARARDILAVLEDSRDGGQTGERLEGLPLFQASAASAAPRTDPLRAALYALDPDALSPRDAHAALYELTRLLRQGGQG
jgi:DNA mismatch repair protein MutS